MRQHPSKAMKAGDDSLNPPGVFATTHWSVVFKAGETQSPQHTEALRSVCENYWYPLYAYARRRGRSPEDAQDLTQEFFRRLLQNNFLDRADQSQGRFRTFLLSAFEHLLSNEQAHANRLKRGGGRALASLNEETAEGRYRIEPADQLTPERAYERHWALGLLDAARHRLREEYAAPEKQAIYQQLERYLSGSRDEGGYAQAAEKLGMSEAAVKVGVHRLRRRYGELLRAEIRQTVGSPAEVEEELRHLFSALRS